MTRKDALKLFEALKYLRIVQTPANIGVYSRRDSKRKEVSWLQIVVN